MYSKTENRCYKISEWKSPSGTYEEFVDVLCAGWRKARVALVQSCWKIFVMSLTMADRVLAPWDTNEPITSHIAELLWLLGCWALFVSAWRWTNFRRFSASALSMSLSDKSISFVRISSARFTILFRRWNKPGPSFSSSFPTVRSVGPEKVDAAWKNGTISLKKSEKGSRYLRAKINQIKVYEHDPPILQSVKNHTIVGMSR